MKKLEEYVVSIPDFPEPGIIFRDVTSILQDADGLALAIDSIREMVKDLDYDVVVGPESRGFIFGVPVAYAEHKSFVPIRKKGKLPRETITAKYDLEYGSAEIEIHKDAIKPGQKVVVVDDLIATGGTTGTYYAVGNALVTTIGDKLSLSKLTAVDSGASKANVQLVTANQAQMSILQSDVLNYAHNGSGGETMFDGAADKNSLWVAGVYNETVQLVTAPSITSIEDLKGKTVCVGDVGSGTALNAAQVLEAYDMTFDDIKVMYDSFSGGAEALKNGQCDAAFTVSGAPTPALTDLATAYNFNMPSLSDEAVSYLTTNYPFLVQDNLPANTYTCVADETVCVAVKAVFTASKDLSEDVVYEITKAMFDNQADLAKAQAKFGYLSPEGAVAGSFDLHPGAEKYYKEIGVL